MLTAEILVVGSGAIGSVFARLLAEAGCQVTMIDAGPVLSDPPGDHLRNTAIDEWSPGGFGDIVGSFLQPISVAAERSGVAPAGENPEQRKQRNLEAAASQYAVGGMLTQWSCVIPRPRGKHLLDEISAGELAGLYSAAESLFSHDRALTGNDPVDVVLTEHLTRAGHRIEPLPLAATIDPEGGSVRYTGSAQILGDALGSIQLLPQHVCRELRWRRAGDRSVIEAAIVVDLLRDRELTIAADAVVVACNAVLTPQLLFASGIWRERLPALGKFLTDHPKFFGQVRLAPELMEQIAVRAAEDVRRADHVARVPAPALMIPTDVESGRPWHSQITCDPMPANTRPPGIDRPELVQLRWFAPCGPRRDNEVCYSRTERDVFGMPQPTFDFSLSVDDRRVVTAMIDDCRAVAQLLGGFIPGFEGRMQPPGHSLHAAGTFRIGDDPETSVCDLDSRVWCFENLYLGGTGTIPNAHSVNPTLTAAVVAVRAAQRLSSRLAPAASNAPANARGHRL